MKPNQTAVIKQHVVIEKHLFNTTRNDYEPELYSIEVDDYSIDGIRICTAQIIYESLGKFLNEESMKS
jgi:hypothetical protein